MANASKERPGLVSSTLVRPLFIHFFWDNFQWWKDIHLWKAAVVSPVNTPIVRTVDEANAKVWRKCFPLNKSVLIIIHSVFSCHFFRFHFKRRYSILFGTVTTASFANTHHLLIAGVTGTDFQQICINNHFQCLKFALFLKFTSRDGRLSTSGQPPQWVLLIQRMGRLRMWQMPARRGQGHHHHLWSLSGLQRWGHARLRL